MHNSERTSLDKQSEMLEAALNSHKNGDFQRAKSLYLKILELNPLHADSLHFLGVIELQASNWELAAFYIGQSLAINPLQAGALNNYGIVLKELGEYSHAIEQFQRTIQLNYSDAKTYLNLGNAYQAQGNYDLAVSAYNTCIVLDPSLAAPLCNRAFALARLGNHVQAVLNYKLALIITPADPNIYNNLGNSLIMIGENDIALDCFEKAVDLNPNFADAYFNKANLLRDLGEVQKALDFYGKAIQINSGQAEHHMNQGDLLRALEQPGLAIQSFNQAIHIRPSYARAYNNRGNAALDLGRISAALMDYSLAIALDPLDAQAYNNRANALRLLADPSSASINYLRAICLDPFYAEAHNNLGVLLMETFRTQSSLKAFDNAIEFKPSFEAAYFNKANALRELKRFDCAIEEYGKAHALNSDYEFLRGLFLHSKMQICDWMGLPKYLEELRNGIQRGEKCTPPFPVLALLDSPELQLKAATLWSQTKFPIQNNENSLPKLVPNNKNSKIRIAYFSADFRDHPVAYLMADLFEHHDRDKFEIIAFSLGPIQQSAMRDRLERSFDIWMESSNLSDNDVVIQARALQLNIAVDLGGFTRNSRTGIFAQRVAPVQVSYIGYLGTMGAPYIDYLLADKVLIPKESRSFYSEKIAYLPIYQANDSKRLMSNNFISRKDLGAPEGAFVYCCFNANYKLTPQVFASWMRILKRVKGSVLLMYADTEFVRTNLQREAVASGIAASRICFANRVPPPEYLLRYTLTDLFLDTSPYNAGTTASDALWSGLPVLTLAGRTFASRIASSLLQALGMPELITHSVQEYEDLAVEIGQNPIKLDALRKKLKTQKVKSNLFNTSKFTVELERIYLEMNRREMANEPLSHIDI